ncbi:MAG: protein-L-isoaspartate O-methyltransferase [Alphaproteobacteria bacterium]|nr:protein-L-isoaspartate O-methyltransferase [Alphaproteobacteria bacterium]|tara:strand:+ start:2260 stop:2913 length:654 start_codon:yes stop_codon:yes gene_type:complete
MSEFAAARETMVLSQLQPDRVSDDRVRDAMGDVPRERFVPEHLHAVAYVDEDLEIAPGRYLMEPRVFARLLQAANIDANDVVLDVGCGSGYSSAVIARLAGTVVALESDQALRDLATRNLEQLEADNVVVISGDLDQGYATKAPYDVVFINGAVGEVPANLVDQLSDGGRLITVVEDETVGRGTLLTSQGGQADSLTLFDAQVPYLPGFERRAEFKF